MRLATYLDDGNLRCGVVAGDALFDTATLAADAGLDAAEPLIRTSAVLRGGRSLWSALGEAAAAADGGLPLAELTLGPPVPDPDKIICLGLNYRDHAAEANLPEPAAPMIFAKFRNSLVGPTDQIVIPASTSAVDYEAELAVVIGRTAKRVAAAEALDYVAGLTVFDDVSARDLQFATSQWGTGKAIDTFAPCGPAVVTLDEIDDVQNLAIRTLVNGELVQDGNTREMIFGVAATIEFLSRQMTLVPGDLIATGTPAGVGMSRQPELLLSPGDVVEVEIESLGSIRNELVAEQRS